MPAAEDQNPVQAFGPDRAYPPARRMRSLAEPDRGLDDVYAFGAEDLIEGAGELGVPVPDHEPDCFEPLPTARLRACWVTHAESGFRVTPRMCTRRDRSSMAKSTYRVRSESVSTVKKSNARIPRAWARRNSLQVGPARRGAGPRPFPRSSVRILVAETLMPSLASSPRILRHPYLGLSLPIRTMSSRTSSVIGGLQPTQVRLKVHFLRTSSRCHRRSVCGLTTNDDHQARGRVLLMAAMNNRSRRRRRGRPALRLRIIS
jgi:hypothetical protein